MCTIVTTIIGIGIITAIIITAITAVIITRRLPRAESSYLCKTRFWLRATSIATCI